MEDVGNEQGNVNRHMTLEQVQDLSVRTHASAAVRNQLGHAVVRVEGPQTGI